MNFVTKKKRVPQIVLTSLMDLLAILLIFFMVTTQFKQAFPQVELSLPEARMAKDPGVSKDEPLYLTIDKDNKLFLRDKPIQIDQLPDLLKQEKANKKDVVLELRSDEKVNFGTIIKVMDAAKEAKIDNIKAITKKPGEGSQ